MEQQLPTFRQLEKLLSQEIQKLYREELKHSPHKVISKFFGNQLVIIIEDALTAVEKTLANRDNENKIVSSLNLAINGTIKSKLKIIIEAVLAVEIEELLFGSRIETKRTGAIAILSQLPQIRNPRSVLKIKTSQHKSEQDDNQADEKSSTFTTELKEPEIL